MLITQVCRTNRDYVITVCSLTLSDLYLFRCDLKLRRVFQGLLDLAQLRRANQRAVILFGERRRYLDLNIDLIHQTRLMVGMMILGNANILCGQVTLLAEFEYVIAHACRDGYQEQVKGHGPRVFTSVT